MLLAVDIGNSTTAIALYRSPTRRCRALVTKLPTHPVLTPLRYRRTILAFLEENVGQQSELLARNAVFSIISSVVPAATSPIVKALRGICAAEPLIVSSETAKCISFKVPRPREVGADRIANIIAAYEFYGTSVAVADLGTATTISIAGMGGEFLGGAIMPGLDLMAAALRSGTAQLPRIALARPAGVLGSTTATAMCSGILHGTAGAVERLIEGMEKQLGFKLQLVLSGGYGSLMSPLIRRRHRLVPHLTVEGMRLIYLRQRQPNPGP